jgi:hypothetical protein
MLAPFNIPGHGLPCILVQRNQGVWALPLEAKKVDWQSMRRRFDPGPIPIAIVRSKMAPSSQIQFSAITMRCSKAAGFVFTVLSLVAIVGRSAAAPFAHFGAKTAISYQSGAEILLLPDIAQ